MSAIVEKAKAFMMQHNISYTTLASISNFNGKAKKDNNVFVLSGCRILILAKKKLSSNLVESNSQSLFDLLSILISTENFIIFHFKKEKHIRFQIGNPQSLVDIILDHVHRIFTPFEFSKLIHPMPSISLSPATSHSILFRLNSLLALNSIEITEKLRKKISDKLLSHSHSFIITKHRKLGAFLPVFFPCLSMTTYIDEIDIKGVQMIPYMLQQIECFDNISHAMIKGPDSPDLKNFVLNSEKINSVSFHDCEVNNFNNIRSLMRKGKVESVGFDSALEKKYFRSFLNASGFKNLKYFRLSNLNVDFSYCCSRFMNLFQLSLVNCNLLIGNVFDLIFVNNFRSLKKLDLSKNIGRGFTDDNNTKLPKNIEVVFADDVEWEPSQLLIFLGLCKDTIITLSLNNIKCDNWGIVYKDFPTLMKSLRTLNWNYNILHENFCIFVKNSPKLVEISLCHCSDLNIIEKFMYRKIQTANLKNLNSDNFLDFLNHIPQMKDLRQVDISSNGLNDECFGILGDSLLASKIEQIAFDDTKVSSHGIYMNLARKLATRELPIKISWPLIDFNKFNMDKLEFSDFIETFDNLQKPLSKRSSNTPKYLPDVYFLRLDKTFPQFMTKKEIDQYERRRQRHFSEDEEIGDTKPNISKNRSNTISTINVDDEISHHQSHHRRSRSSSSNSKRNNKSAPVNKNQNNLNITNNNNNINSNDFWPSKYNLDQNKSEGKEEIKNYGSSEGNYSVNNNNKPNFVIDTENFDIPKPTFGSQIEDKQEKILNEENKINGGTVNKNAHSVSSIKKVNRATGNDDSNVKKAARSQIVTFQKKRAQSALRTSKKPNDDNKKDEFAIMPNVAKRHWIKNNAEHWKPTGLPKPPKIDNTMVMMNYQKEYSLHKLLKLVMNE